MKRFIHDFSLTFSIVSHEEDPDQINPQLLKSASLTRIKYLEDAELSEAFEHLETIEDGEFDISDLVDMLPKKGDTFRNGEVTTEIRSVINNVVSTYAGDFDLKDFLRNWEKDS